MFTCPEHAVVWAKEKKNLSVGFYLEIKPDNGSFMLFGAYATGIGILLSTDAFNYIEANKFTYDIITCREFKYPRSKKPIIENGRVWISFNKKYRCFSQQTKTLIDDINKTCKFKFRHFIPDDDPVYGAILAEYLDKDTYTIILNLIREIQTDELRPVRLTHFNYSKGSWTHLN
jgi:hypothetical protein